ncbi:hypothetical protein LBMAG42_07880 [Deltaproteobacteria bacterium]|nr:hypothetical protein LBMAG42_07880 [Deltaproteobacteria bacterium]
MPSPIAHVAVAVAAALAAPDGSPLRARSAVLAAAVASLLPDLDLLAAATLPGGIEWHHGPTHSLLGAGFLAFAFGLAVGLRGAPLLWTMFCGFLHPILDWELGVPGGPSTFGVPLFWPMIATKFIAPYPLFRPFNIHEAGFITNMFTPAALGPYLRELVFAAVVLGYVRFTRGRFRVLPRRAQR